MSFLFLSKKEVIKKSNVLSLSLVKRFLYFYLNYQSSKSCCITYCKDEVTFKTEFTDWLSFFVGIHLNFHILVLYLESLYFMSTVFLGLYYTFGLRYLFPFTFSFNPLTLFFSRQLSLFYLFLLSYVRNIYKYINEHTTYIHKCIHIRYIIIPTGFLLFPSSFLDYHLFGIVFF